jgi:hypothetical protein
MYGSTSFCTAILVSCPLSPAFRVASQTTCNGGGAVRERGKLSRFFGPLTPVALPPLDQSDFGQRPGAGESDGLDLVQLVRGVNVQFRKCSM